MNKSAFTPVWEMMRLRHGIALRCIEALPADQLDSHPIRSMRTPKELVVHMYTFMRVAPESVTTGTLGWDEPAELAKIKTRDELVAFARNCWKVADAAFAKITDAQLAGKIKAPWGDSTAIEILNAVPDEFLHHRGQLYAYLRQLGVKPPENSDFEHNAPELQPSQHA
ncbi:MAG TPA: DinB family protein [Candidatus Eisenbacteria bacterium]|jgi:uncharacterized damage-inducible protein DinB